MYKSFIFPLKANVYATNERLPFGLSGHTHLHDIPKLRKPGWHWSTAAQSTPRTMYPPQEQA